MVGLIVAMDNTGAIGKNNGLPWPRIKADMQHFRKTTMGHTVVMGRKTFESMGKPLDGRHNVVLTRNNEWSYDGVTVCHSVDEVLALCPWSSTPNTFVIGGAEIYDAFLPHASKVIITHIPGHYDADTWWKPNIDVTTADCTPRHPVPGKLYLNTSRVLMEDLKVLGVINCYTMYPLRPGSGLDGD